MIEEVKILISKTKLALLLVGALLLLAAGIWLSLDPGRFDSERQLNVFNIMIAGIIAAVFFGACAIFILKKLIRNSYGLMINDEGITDYSTGVSLGLIKWADIVDIRTLHVQRRHKFILVEVRNPEAYIASAKSRITKMAIKANHRLYGSPININPGSLKSNFPDLFKTIEAAYHKYLQENQSID